MKIFKSVFALFILMAVFSGCSDIKIIINDLEEQEANEIIVFLANNNIDAQKVAGKSRGTGGRDTGTKWNIGVGSQEAIRAMSILTKNGLPRKKGTDLLDLFAKSGLVPSELEEQIRYHQGLAQQLSKTIRKIDGIVDADVQLSFPKEDPLNPQKVIGKTTAAVFVKHQGVLDDPNSLLTTKIKRLVSGSVQGLKFDDVTVIADQARFSIISPQTKPIGQASDEKFVKIWSVVLASSSAGRFRTIFFLFVTSIIVLFTLFAFMLWRIYPIIEKTGGFAELMSFRPLAIQEKAEEVEEKKEGEEEATKEDEEEGEEEEEESADDEDDWSEEEEKGDESTTQVM